jgi:integrating conjugative element protein (TIGR03755 family)
MSRRFLRRYLSSAIPAALVVGAMLSASPVWAQQIPNGQSRLYYRIGGADPASRSSNPNSISVRLGLAGSVRLNYSCGKFDLAVSFQALMQGVKDLGVNIINAVKAGISALPMYIFQRAQPGLYELFQTYSFEAKTIIAQALKTCEEMEAQIKAGGDPYEDWIKLAKVEDWKFQASTSQDVVVSKTAVETNNGRQGISWLNNGTKQGGFGQSAIAVINDMVAAGYKITMNVPTAASDTIAFPTTGATATRLAKAFQHPSDASAFATDVLGDLQIATCDEPSCPPKGSKSGLGLIPKFDLEFAAAQPQVTALLAAGVPTFSALDAASAPGVSFTRELVDALRDMPAIEQNVASTRLAREIALARTIDRALIVRNLLLTGMSAPQAGMEVAQNEARKKIEQMNRYIDDLLFESRVRKEIFSGTASAILDSGRSSKVYSTTNGTQAPADSSPLLNGRVK